MTKPNKFFGIFFLLFIAAYHANAQKGVKIIGNFYYLEFPRGDIFNTAFSIPDGLNDPKSVPATSDLITDSDLEVSAGASKQTRMSITNRNNSFLLNSWSHKKGISVSTEFYKVKHTQVKNLSWAKYKDQAYHVIEAISADSALIKIYKSKSDTFGTGILQTITKLFLGKNSDVGKVLTALGNTDSTTKTQKDIVKLKSSSKDTLTLMINDNKVYFAVRYAKINEAKTGKVWSLLSGRRDEAPYCGPMVIKNPPPTIEFTLGEKQKTYNLIGENCSIKNYMVKALFVNDFPEGGTVYITKEYKGSAAQNTKKSKPIVDTVYISETINFSDEYFNRSYNDSRPFVADAVAKASGSKNTLVVCDFEFSFDPKSRRISVVNYPKKDNFYHTCIYQMSADIVFFPN